MRTLVHVTHEAVHQAGGIGTVLRGLITASAYRQQVQRTVLIGYWEPFHRSLSAPMEQ